MAIDFAHGDRDAGADADDAASIRNRPPIAAIDTVIDYCDVELRYCDAMAGRAELASLNSATEAKEWRRRAEHLSELRSHLNQEIAMPKEAS